MPLARNRRGQISSPYTGEIPERRDALADRFVARSLDDDADRVVEFRAEPVNEQPRTEWGVEGMLPLAGVLVIPVHETTFHGDLPESGAVGHEPTLLHLEHREQMPSVTGLDAQAV